MYGLTATNLSKRFGHRKVFSEVAFELTAGQSLAVVGPNGSGKSTLLQTILGLLRPNRGEVIFTHNGNKLNESDIRSLTSLVAPYLNLYDQLTGEENLQFFATVSSGSVTGKEINRLLAKVGLEGRGSDRVGEYSSGMKQRMKYAVALLGQPRFLFLDEPTANLDEDGKQVVEQIIEEYRSEAIIVIATNEKEEYHLARQQVILGN